MRLVDEDLTDYPNRPAVACHSCGAVDGLRWTGTAFVCATCAPRPVTS